MPAFVSEASVSHNAPYIDPQWPRGVLLYQPIPDSQMTLNDNANCLAVKALLHMNDLDFKVASRTNAEDMSPTGKVPFLRADKDLVAEWEPIMAFVNAKKYNLGSHLELWQKAEMKAYMSLVENVLKPAELWSSWCDEETAYQVTKPRYGSPYPWPLNSLLARRKQRAVWTIVRALGWRDKTAEKVYDEVNRCCLALSNRLGSSNYFFGHHQPNKAINGTKAPLNRQQAEDKEQAPESESQQKAPSDGNKMKSKLGGRRRWPKIYVDKQKSVEEVEFVEKTYEEDMDGIVTESVSTSIIEQRQDKKATRGTADSLRPSRKQNGIVGRWNPEGSVEKRNNSSEENTSRVGRENQINSAVKAEKESKAQADQTSDVTTPQQNGSAINKDGGDGKDLSAQKTANGPVSARQNGRYSPQSSKDVFAMVHQEERDDGTKPTELDALVFGHLHSLLAPDLSHPRLQQAVQQHGNLAAFCHRVARKYFSHKDDSL
ncbi:uncharacterized protein [Branchiostoma lanceolatum]|uniref:uncharacterized protein n=1 Tax=Branchiostoma lanceolatum TaxID=7740 RepID=UPI0034559438